MRSATDSFAASPHLVPSVARIDIERHGPTQEVSQAHESIEQGTDLQRALMTLSDEEREAIALRFGADMAVPEIARLQGERLTTVEGRVYRALRKLRDELS